MGCRMQGMCPGPAANALVPFLLGAICQYDVGILQSSACRTMMLVLQMMLLLQVSICFEVGADMRYHHPCHAVQHPDLYWLVTHMMHACQTE